MIRERGNPSLHFLDRYVGIPAIAALGCIRRQRPLPPRIESIGLLKAGAIGDTVLMGGVIADLRQSFPFAKLIFFAGRSNFEIAGMIDGVDRVVEVAVKYPFTAIKTIRSIPLDVMIDFGQWSRLEALLAICSGAGCTIGFSTPGQYRQMGFDVTIGHSGQIHEQENYRRLVQVLGVETTHLPTLRVPEARAPSARDYAVMHLWPGGIRSELKEWPSANWLRLAREFVQWGLDVVLTGGASDRGRNEELIDRLPSGVRQHLSNAAGVSVSETCSILANSRLVVSVNTGVMHLAAALGVPLIALSGPTSSRRWGPVSADATTIDSPLPGSGYLNLGWEYPSRPPKCMEAITYEMVRNACQVAMEKQALPRP